MSKNYQIALDGYSSTGKSTLAKQIAKELDIVHVDSGAMYRAITLYALDEEIITKNGFDAQELIKQLPTVKISFKKNVISNNFEILLNNKIIEDRIRTMRVAEKVSAIAQVKEVRSYLVDIQQNLGDQFSVIMDGRDIGTMVFPNADIKIFLTAEPMIRAERRFKELVKNNPDITLDKVYENLQERDYQDTTRKISPLVQAKDAVILDNSYLTPSETLDKAIHLIQSKCPDLLKNN